VHVCVG